MADDTAVTVARLRREVATLKTRIAAIELAVFPNPPVEEPPTEPEPTDPEPTDPGETP